jgi:pimeloyl-ACP methyl ester carboxylesterase
MAEAEPTSGYAPVNELSMFYEIHGSGSPLVLLHGAFMSVGALGEWPPALAKSRRVIVPELQAHGHTADVDRPLTYEQLADDVAGLLEHLGIERADVFGYSLGGGTALQLAIRHPKRIRKLVVASATYNSDGFYPEVLPAIGTLKPELFEGSSFLEAYRNTAPDPDRFPVLVEKIKQLDLAPQDWPAGSIRGIEAPTLIVIGDSDGTRPEHAVEMFRLLGGGVMGDLAGLPKSQLAILPGTSHLGMLGRTDWLVPMVAQFLDAPLEGES